MYFSNGGLTGFPKPFQACPYDNSGRFYGAAVEMPYLAESNTKASIGHPDMDKMGPAKYWPDYLICRRHYES